MAIIPWESGLDFGVGYDVVTGEPKQRGVDGTGLPPENAVGQEGDTAFRIITSREDFDQALKMDLRVNAGVGLLGGSLKFKFRNECKASSQVTFCVLRVLATNAFERIPEPKLSRKAWDLLASGNAKRFRERFGDCFVSGRHVGVEFYGVIRIEASTMEKGFELAAGLSASYTPLLEGDASVEFSQTMRSEYHHISVLTYQRGGSIQVCRSLEELASFAKDALAEGRAGRGYPFSVMLDPYEELELPGDGASPIQIDAARRAMERALRDRDALSSLQNDIDFVLRNRAWFEPYDPGPLNAANQAISAEINKLVERADICSRDFAACEDYSPVYPEVTLPQRKAGSVGLPTPAPAAAVVGVPRLIGEGDTMGLKRVDAEDLIRRSELMVGEITTEFSSADGWGRVIRQDPAPGTLVNRLSLVNVVVGANDQRWRPDV